MGNDDRSLAERLRRYESRVPDMLDAPAVVGRRRRRWIPVAGGAAFLILVVAFATTLRTDPRTVGGTSPTPSASEQPSPTPVSAAPSASATAPSSANPIPTSSPSAPPATEKPAFDVEWNEVTTVIDTGTVRRVTQYGGKFFVLGSSADTAAVWSSVEGEEWRRASLPFPAGWEPGPPTSVYAEHLVATDDRLLVIGAASALDYLNVIAWESTDGVTWTEVDTGDFKTDAYRALDVTTGPAGIVAVTHRYGNGTGSAWRSQDGGRSWAEHRPTEGPMTAYAVVGTGDRYVIGGNEIDAENNGHPQIWTSADGAAWTAASVQGSAGVGSIEHVTVDTSGTWVAAGTVDGRAVVWHSMDATTWSLAADFGEAVPETGTRISLLAGIPQGYLAIAGDATGTKLWLSANGASWIERPLPWPQVEGGRGTPALAPGVGRLGDRLFLAGPVVTDLDPAGSTWHSWFGRLVSVTQGQ